MAAAGDDRRALQHLVNKLRMMNKQEQLAQLRIFFSTLDQVDIVEELYPLLARHSGMTVHILKALARDNCRQPEEQTRDT